MTYTLDKLIEYMKSECRDVAEAVSRATNIEGLEKDQLIRKALLYTLFSISNVAKFIKDYVDFTLMDVDWESITACMSAGWTTQSAPLIWDVSIVQIPKILRYLEQHY